MKKTLLATAIGVAFAGFTGAALAQSTSPSTSTARSTDTRSSWLPFTNYGYVGASVGVTDFDIDCRAGFNCDRKNTGFKIYTGGQLWRFVGLDLSYVNVGKAETSGGQVKAQGVNLSLVGNVPIGDRFNVFGKVGSIWGFTKTSAAAPGVNTGKDDGFGLSYGAGVAFDVARNWQVRGEWDRYRFDFKNGRDDVDLFTVGAAYKF